VSSDLLDVRALQGSLRAEAGTEAVSGVLACKTGQGDQSDGEADSSNLETVMEAPEAASQLTRRSGGGA
jgi:hypothetical protein